MDKIRYGHILRRMLPSGVGYVHSILGILGNTGKSPTSRPVREFTQTLGFWRIVQLLADSHRSYGSGLEDQGKTGILG